MLINDPEVYPNLLSDLTKTNVSNASISASEISEETKSIVSKVIQNPIDFLLIPVGEILLIIVVTLLALRFIDQVIDKIFSLSRIESKKAQTLQKLIKSISRYGIYFISFLTILINLGFNPLPVLAGAGILGLAIGFGAQNLIKDIITGFFLIFEGQLEVGDFVQINGKIKGTVEEVGLRITKVREFNQRLHYIANGNISQVTNYNREKMRAIIPITVPYEADFVVVNQALEEIVEEVNQKFESFLMDQPEIMGVTNMDQTGVQFTITALCDPEQYWSLEREMRKISVLILHRYGIQIAYPRSVIYNPMQLEEIIQVKETVSTSKQ